MTIADLSLRYGLKPAEMKILGILAQTPGEVVPRGALPAASYNALSVHVCNINRKLPKSLQILCMYGLGYMLPRGAAIALRRIIERPAGEVVQLFPERAQA